MRVQVPPSAPFPFTSLRNFIDDPRMVNKDNNLYSHKDNDNEPDNIGVGKHVLLAEDSKTNRIIAVSILYNVVLPLIGKKCYGGR